MVGSEKLGMTIEQMEHEIEVMRKFDKYLKDNLEGYPMIVHQFALEESCGLLESVGVDSSEFRSMMDVYKIKEQLGLQ